MSDSQDDGFLRGPPLPPLNDLLADLEDEATIRHYDPQADEWQLDCRLCGQRDGHTDLCPLPAISRWLDAQRWP